MEEIQRGAEAVIFREGDKIIKERVRKGYRHEILDKELRFSRTRREAKVLEKLAAQGIPAPKLISLSKDKIEMEFIDGERLADGLEPKTMAKVGETVAKLHDSNIAHGDLTTSNIIDSDGEIVLIDFGLSFFTHKLEDKAVDIHLLKEALDAKHYEIFREAWDQFKQGYKNCKDYKDVMERLESVEKRGRYKAK